MYVSVNSCEYMHVHTYLSCIHKAPFDEHRHAGPTSHLEPFVIDIIGFGFEKQIKMYFRVSVLFWPCCE